MRPWVRCGFAAVVLAPVLAGCGALSIGYTAVGVDENGAPVAHLVVCEEQIDSLYVRVSDEDYREVGRFETGAAITTSAEISLASPGDEWTVLRPLVEQTDGVKYELSGSNTQDPSIVSEGVVFSPADLASLGPGEVVTQGWKEAPEGYTVPVPVVKTADEFLEHACDDYSGGGWW